VDSQASKYSAKYGEGKKHEYFYRNSRMPKTNAEDHMDEYDFVDL